jgi:hypothetical protein
MNNDDLKRKIKEVQRASYRFDKNIFENFREVCKSNDFNQTKVLEKLMRDFILEIEQEKENDK